MTKDLQKLMKGGTEENQSVEVSQLERKLDQLKKTHEEKVESPLPTPLSAHTTLALGGACRWQRGKGS